MHTIFKIFSCPFNLLNKLFSSVFKDKLDYTPSLLPDQHFDRKAFWIEGNHNLSYYNEPVLL